MADLHVLITMDVEPLKQQPQWTGPEDAAGSERSIRGYRDLAAGHGFPVSFFVHPEAAELHRDLLRRLADQGAGLGLHVHPMKFRHPRYRYELGYYSADEQREMLGLAKGQWSVALGGEPRYFRPGAFSANDTTLPVLVSLGFVGGSVSIPGRVWPQRYCIWAGAELDPHRANARFRHVAGDLPFANIPLSVDTSDLIRRDGVSYFRDLRPTARDVPAETTLRHIIAQIAARRPAVAVLHVVTHNDQPFDDPASESARRMGEVLARIQPRCAEAGLAAVGATFETVCAAVLAQPPRPPAAWAGSNDVAM